MGLLLRLENEKTDALKAKNLSLRSLIGVVVSDATKLAMIEEKSKIPSDAILVRVIRKHILTLRENLAISKDRFESGGITEAKLLEIEEAASRELKALEQWLPSQLTGESLRKAIQYTISLDGLEKSVKNLGKVMASLAQNYSGRYDGKEASVIAKELLQ